MRDYSNDSYVLDHYILDEEFDGRSGLGNPANPHSAWKMLLQGIETALSVPVESGIPVGGREDTKERRRRIKKNLERFGEPERSLSHRIPREKIAACIIAPVPAYMTSFERAVFILGDRVSETKLSYRLDGYPCNTVDIFRAAGVAA